MRTKARWRWILVLVTGFLLWLASVVVTGLTANTNLIPTVVFLGSFTIPVAAVVWNFDHEATTEVSQQRLFFAFIVGGVVGVLSASILEAWLVQDAVFQYLVVGLIEEFVKGLALVLVSLRLSRYTTRDGIVLGAAVGFGFAALESSGYAFNAVLTAQGLSLVSLVQTEVLRGILAPLGHGLWTAVLGGVMFHAARSRSRLRLSWSVVGAYLLVSILHALWDSMRGIAVVVTLALTATRAQMIQIASGQVPVVSPAQDSLFVVIQFTGLVVVSAVGIGVLILIWFRWVHRGRALPSAPEQDPVPHLGE